MNDYTLAWGIAITDSGYKTGHFKQLGFREKARALYLHKKYKAAVYIGTNHSGERIIRISPSR